MNSLCSEVGLAPHWETVHQDFILLAYREATLMNILLPQSVKGTNKCKDPA